MTRNDMLPCNLRVARPWKSLRASGVDAMELVPVRQDRGISQCGQLRRQGSSRVCDTVATVSATPGGRLLCLFYGVVDGQEGLEAGECYVPARHGAVSVLLAGGIIMLLNVMCRPGTG